jgi:hypothetical protein
LSSGELLNLAKEEEDRWDGERLIYTGRGETGDQELKGPNLQVAENRTRLLVFEAAGIRRLRYLGEATCLDKWLARSLDENEIERNVWKFRLGFVTAPPQSVPDLRPPSNLIRRARPFSAVAPAEYQLTRKIRATYEEIAALQEKANQSHFHILRSLAAVLTRGAWTGVQEIPAAVDLQATKADGSVRVIFEVKSLSGLNEAQQCRAALAQLLEYRFLYGDDTDQLCAVFNSPIADRRLAFLQALGIAVVVLDGEGGMCCGERAHSLFGSLFPSGGLPKC